MKKIILSVILSLFIILPAASYEWGGVITENARATTGDFATAYSYSGRQSNSVSLWATIPFNKQSTFYLATQASYKYNFDISLVDNEITHIIDLDLLKLNAAVPVGKYTLNVSAGRFQVMDETNKIFTQNCDGVNLKLATPFLNTTLYAGYTGLLNGYNTTMLGKRGYAEIKNTKLYSLSSPYIPLLVYFDFPSLFLNQSLGLQFSAFLDLGSDAYNRAYGTISLKGPITGPCYYSVATCFGTENFANVSNYSDITFQLFFNSIAIKIEGEYASGKQAIFEPFRGFTSQTAYNINTSLDGTVNTEYSGIIMPGIDFTFFKNNLYINFHPKLVLGIPEESISVNGVDGTLSFVLNIFSDLQLNSTFSAYYDILNSTAERNYSNYTFSLGLALSF